MRNLKTTVATAVLVCCLIATAQADMVTLVAKGPVDSITNVGDGGEPLDPTHVPFAIGDEIRIVITYDSSLPFNNVQACMGGSGRYTAFPVAFSGVVSIGDISGVITSGKQLSVYDCDKEGPKSQDAFIIWGVWNSPIIKYANNSDVVTRPTEFQMAYFTDPTCFTAPITAPTGAFDPVLCPRQSSSVLLLVWRSFFHIEEGGDLIENQISARVFGSFAIEEPTCSDLIRKLTSDVFSLNLRKGISNSIDSKLDAAIAASDDVSGNSNSTAVNQMYAFINSVEAQRGILIADGEADVLTTSAETIIGCLSP